MRPFYDEVPQQPAAMNAWEKPGLSVGERAALVEEAAMREDSCLCCDAGALVMLLRVVRDDERDRCALAVNKVRNQHPDQWPWVNACNDIARRIESGEEGEENNG